MNRWKLKVKSFTVSLLKVIHIYLYILLKDIIDFNDVQYVVFWPWRKGFIFKNRKVSRSTLKGFKKDDNQIWLAIDQYMKIIFFRETYFQYWEYVFQVWIINLKLKKSSAMQEFSLLVKYVSVLWTVGYPIPVNPT